VGQRLRSITSTVEVIVVLAPEAELDLTCGGKLMSTLEMDPPGSMYSPHSTGDVELGARFVDDTMGIGVLVTTWQWHPCRQWLALQKETPGDPLAGVSRR